MRLFVAARRERGEFLGHSAKAGAEGERDRLANARGPLNSAAIGESHFCEDTSAGLHRRRRFLLRSSCAVTDSRHRKRASDSRNSAASSSRRWSDRTGAQERESAARAGHITAHTVVAYSRNERLAVGQS